MTAWLGLLWWMLVLRRSLGIAGAAGRAAWPWFTAALAFVAGLSVMVRPELALIGGVALLCAGPCMNWRIRVLIVLMAVCCRSAIQIFRMGYYGLLVPQTALARTPPAAIGVRGSPT